MKKIIATIISIVTILSCALLGGCSGAQGTYKFSKMTVIDGAQRTEISRGDEYDGVSFERRSMVMEVKKDGTLVFTAPYFNEEPYSGDWEYYGDKTAVLNVYTKGVEIITAEYNGGKVYLYVFANGVDFEIVLS